MRNFLRLMLALMLTLAPISALAQQKAEPEDGAESVEIVGTLWCDTADQLETVLRSHFTDKVPMTEAMAAINQFSPEACVVARAIISKGAEVRRVTAGDNIMSLYSAKVMGIMRGQYALMMRPQVWYGVQVVAELTPL